MAKAKWRVSKGTGDNRGAWVVSKAGVASEYEAIYRVDGEALADHLNATGFAGATGTPTMAEVEKVMRPEVRSLVETPATPPIPLVDALALWTSAVATAPRAWDRKEMPYRVSRYFSTNAPGCYGWLSQTITAPTLEKAMELGRAALRVPKTTHVEVDVVEERHTSEESTINNWKWRNLRKLTRSKAGKPVEP